MQVTCLTVPARFGVVAYHHVPDKDALSSASASARATPCVWPSRRGDPFGLRIWQKLMVYAGEQLRLQREPLSPRLVRALRAAGGTSLQGIWGDHARHGDTSLLPAFLTSTLRRAGVRAGTH